MPSRTKILLAREFRKKPTKSESILWDNLRGNRFDGYYFRRQHVISGFIIDFYCPKLKLAIEIDGDVHLQSKKADSDRQEAIEEKKIKFFRVNSKEVENNFDLVLKRLKDFIRNL